MAGKFVALSLLSSLLMASAKPLNKRAGAPIPLPIPSNCTIMDSNDCSGNTCAPSKHFRANTATIQESQLYAYYLPMDDPQVTQKSPNQLYQDCLETCYGYGLSGDCKSVWTSTFVPTIQTVPQEAYACELYSVYLGPANFQIVNSTDYYIDSRVGNIYCPVAAANATLSRRRF